MLHYVSFIVDACRSLWHPSGMNTIFNGLLVKKFSITDSTPVIKNHILLYATWFTCPFFRFTKKGFEVSNANFSQAQLKQKLFNYTAQSSGTINRPRRRKNECKNNKIVIELKLTPSETPCFYQEVREKKMFLIHATYVIEIESLCTFWSESLLNTLETFLVRNFNFKIYDQHTGKGMNNFRAGCFLHMVMKSIPSTSHDISK